MFLLRNIAPDHGDEIAEEEGLVEEGTLDLGVTLGAVVTDEADEVLEGDISHYTSTRSPCSRISVASVL